MYIQGFYSADYEDKIVRDWIEARGCELIIAVLTRIYQQRREEWNVGGCQTIYMTLSWTHDLAEHMTTGGAQSGSVTKMH